MRNQRIKIDVYSGLGETEAAALLTGFFKSKRDADGSAEPDEI